MFPMPENIVSICVALDITILGIAYPIISDKISNIGEKFKSQYIPVIFESEFPQRKLAKFSIGEKEFKITYFKLILFVTLLTFFFQIFQFSPPKDSENYLVNNSADLVLLVLTVTLTIFLLIWLDKVGLYNGKAKSLLTYLIKKYNSYL